MFIEPLHKLAERPTLHGVPKEPDCVVRARFGLLTPSRVDHWWKVDTQTEVQELIKDVTTALVSYGLPWFESFTNFKSLGGEYERQKDYFMASLAYHLAGEHTLASERMQTALAKANKHFKPRAERIAASLQLATQHG